MLSVDVFSVQTPSGWLIPELYFHAVCIISLAAALLLLQYIKVTVEKCFFPSVCVKGELKKCFFSFQVYA